MPFYINYSAPVLLCIKSGKHTLSDNVFKMLSSFCIVFLAKCVQEKEFLTSHGMDMIKVMVMVMVEGVLTIKFKSCLRVPKLWI